MVKQPALCDKWGIPFYGKAETTTGNVWWYVDQYGNRIPLIPISPIAGITPRENSNGN